jgi:hypothetical protein
MSLDQKSDVLSLESVSDNISGMHGDTLPPSRAATWITALATALTLYVLSVGPVDGLATRSSGGGDRWFPVVYGPLFWATDDTAFERPLWKYRVWCDDLMGIGVLHHPSG